MSIVLTTRYISTSQDKQRTIMPQTSAVESLILASIQSRRKQADSLGCSLRSDQSTQSLYHPPQATTTSLFSSSAKRASPIASAYDVHHVPRLPAPHFQPPFPFQLPCTSLPSRPGSKSQSQKYKHLKTYIRKGVPHVRGRAQRGKVGLFTEGDCSKEFRGHVFGRNEPLLLTFEDRVQPVFEVDALNKMSFTEGAKSPLPEAQVFIFTDKQICGIEFIVDQLTLNLPQLFAQVDYHTPELLTIVGQQFLIVLLRPQCQKFTFSIHLSGSEQQFSQARPRRTYHASCIVLVFQPIWLYPQSLGLELTSQNRHPLFCISLEFVCGPSISCDYLNCIDFVRHYPSSILLRRGGDYAELRNALIEVGNTFEFGFFLILILQDFVDRRETTGIFMSKRQTSGNIDLLELVSTVPEQSTPCHGLSQFFRALLQAATGQVSQNPSPPRCLVLSRFYKFAEFGNG